MKELIKSGNADSGTIAKDTAAAVSLHIASAIIGFAFSRGVILSELMPFGISFAAGCPSGFTPAAALGVFIGYFIPAAGNSGFRYIAAMFAILAIKLMLSSYKKISESPMFLSTVCLCACAMTGLVSLKGDIVGILRLCAESLLSGGGAFFVSRAGRALIKREAGLAGDELSAVLIVISILLIGLSHFSLYGITLSGILGILLILAAAKYGGILSGAISGIAVALCFSLTDTRPDQFIFYALGGMMAGVFASLGKYAQIAAFSACALISSSLGGFGTITAVITAELALGIFFFLILPRSAGIYLGKIFSCYPKIVMPIGAKKAVMLRLKMASFALSDVSQTVEQVSAELGRINAPDFSGVISGIESDACAGCKLRVHCWESKRDDTVAAILEMTKAVKNGELSPDCFAPEEFKGRCLRIGRVSQSAYHRYSDYASRIAAESRIDEVRSVVSEQFDGISDMLTDLAQEFENDGQFDTSAALNAVSALKNINIHIDECCSRIDKFGRMTIDLKLKKTEDTILNKLQIMRVLSSVCERDFSVPSINESAGEVFITITEQAAYRVELGISQFSAIRGSICGDAYSYFDDGKGHFIMILSDGMGTGGRAAVDGAMASGLMSRLLKAGFGYDCSLRILNSSMLFKSSDESLATLDIASIDLFTGEAELYKAGAAPTLVRRSGRTGKAVSNSLPIGILNNINFDRAGIRLTPGDILLLLSDGAISEGTDWIRAELEAWRDGSAEDLAEHINECARRRRAGEREDDITVMAAILKKCV